MDINLQSPDFASRQLEKLNAFKNNTPNNGAPKPEVKPIIVENEVKPVVNKIEEPITAPVQKQTTESTAKPGDNKEGDKEEVTAETQVPTQKRVDLDKKEEEKNPIKAEVDSDTKAYLKELLDEEEAASDKAPSEKENKVNYEEEVKTYKTKLQEYEGLLNDDYVKAMVEFRKSGGTDLNELNRQLGIVDPSKYSIEDFYKEEASRLGFKGEELDEAVSESVDKYNGLSKIEQKQILQNFQNSVKNKAEEKIKSFSAQNQAQRQEVEKIEKIAIADINKEVQDKIGKKWKGLLIDEKMGKEIANDSPKYLMPQIDDKGRLIAFDAKNAVRLAILDKFEKKLLKASYELGALTKYDELIQERNRPNENMTSNQIVVNAPNDIVLATKRQREEKRKHSGSLTNR